MPAIVALRDTDELVFNKPISEYWVGMVFSNLRDNLVGRRQIFHYNESYRPTSIALPRTLGIVVPLSWVFTGAIFLTAIAVIALVDKNSFPNRGAIASY